MVNLSGKVVLITGASRGIGKDIALELSRCGASIALNYKKDERGVNSTLNTIKQSGGYARIYKADVSCYEEVKDMVENIINEFGKIDILINNAGISKIGLFSDMNEEEWDQIIDTDIKGVLNCTHNVLKDMISRKKGTIINISSMWGNCGASCETVYSASKGAVNAFTKALAREMGPSGIRVNAIAPGVITTDMNKWLSEEEKSALKNEIPLMSFGDVSDISKLAAFLSSDDSKYITGQIITVDGGMC